MENDISLAKGSAIFFISSLWTYVTRFATGVIIARSLGVEGKGIYFLILVSGSLLALALSLGLNSALTYFTASKAFRPTDLFTIAGMFALTAGTLGAFIFYLLYGWTFSQTILSGVGLSSLIIMLFTIPLNLLTSYNQSILLGFQQISKYNLVEIVRSSANLLFQIVSAMVGGGIKGAVLAWAFSIILALGLSLTLLKPHLTLLALPKLASNIPRPLFGYGLKSYIANLLTFFNYRLDSYLVNYFSGPTRVGLYSTGVGLAEVIWHIPNSISSTLFPRVTRLEESSAHQVTAQTCRTALLVIVPAAVALGAVGIPLIPFIYGRAFNPSVPPFLLLLPGIVGISLSKILSAYFSGRGSPEFATRNSAITVLLTIILDIILIPSYGIIGAAVASSIAYLSSALLLIVWFSRRTKTQWPALLIPKKQDAQILCGQAKKLISDSGRQFRGWLARKSAGL